MKCRPQRITECDGVDRAEHLVSILEHALGIGVACFESLLCREDFQETIEVALRCLNLLEIPFREFEMWTIFERRPVVRVVQRNGGRAGR